MNERSWEDQLDMRTAATIEGVAHVSQTKIVRGLFP